MATTTAEQSDRHRSKRIVRIRPPFLEHLETLVKRRGTTHCEEVNRAVRELLEREGLWRGA